MRLLNPADVERISGARTVVISQWSVSDRAMKELMVAFYQNYVESRNKAIALQKAMHLNPSISILVIGQHFGY